MIDKPVTLQAFIDARTFSAFAWFDLLSVQKRWRRPALFAAFFTLVVAPGKEFADIFFVLTPDKNLSRKEVNQRNREHIADYADNICPEKLPAFHTHTDRDRDCSSELDNRNH